ncbi:hypothetical protein M407DRAFT_214464 [Tulasnella calospora MUT 4182]|uniref:Uncharacterized protein n=1 Tax=Tulasnella calospora MUT 4182 TaxID=1051891 RepID=A0A0C3QEQ5_9AGAM|nr:hypothetical protein M407DRAFT_214464 [Tulasnella calospora MUT 4182]
MIRASMAGLALLNFGFVMLDEERRVFYDDLADYCLAVKGRDWGFLSLASRTISWFPRDGMRARYSETDLESIRKAYMGSANNHPHRGVDVTLLDLDEAFTAVLDHENRDRLDNYGIITGVLRCVEYIVASGRSSGSMELERQFRLLGSCEAALRTVTPQDDNIEIIRRIRIDALTVIKELLPGPETGYASYLLSDAPRRRYANKSPLARWVVRDT